MPASISCSMDLPSLAGSFGWHVASVDTFDATNSRRPSCDDESPPESNSCITSFQDHHSMQYSSQVQPPLMAGTATEYSVQPTPPLMDYSNTDLFDWSQSPLPYFHQDEQMLGSIDQSCQMINFPLYDQFKSMNQDFLQDQEITSPSDLSIYQSLLQGLLDTDRPASYGTHPIQYQEPFSQTSSTASMANQQQVEISVSGSTSWKPSSFCKSTPPTQQIQNENSNLKHSSLEARDQTGEPALKKPRIMAPSPLPTFKVRKEKLGDRITALQQLVSPFGKTDTASVLQEAIDYIKFLHDQIRDLSAPYLKNGHQVQQSFTKANEGEGLAKQDLGSRGLCVMPISSTFGIASEAPVDFWASMFGGRYC